MEDKCIVCEEDWKSYSGDYDSLCDEHYLEIEPTKRKSGDKGD